ncbi:MAG: RidA family protein [Planctomycetes bacterium]|nr:RidA family protein [Planctomycetota bacterium]
MSGGGKNGDGKSGAAKSRPRRAGIGAVPRSIEPPGWPRPKGYSNGRLAPAGARLLTIAGQVGWDERERLVGSDFAAQFGQALKNVRAVLEAAGGAPEHLLRLTYYVTDKTEYVGALAEVGERYRAVLGRVFPAATLIEVKGLVEPGAKVEIEATAALPPDPPDHTVAPPRPAAP